MLSIIMMLALQPVASTPITAQVQPCVWPNRCVQQTLAQVQTCVWPHPCRSPRLG